MPKVGARAPRREAQIKFVDQDVAGIIGMMQSQDLGLGG
jgi:hypothetical protein